MRPGPKGVTLSRELQLTPEDRWLLLAVRRTSGAPAGKIFARINGEPAGEFEIPFFGNEMPKPLTLPLGKYAGQKVRVELEQREAEKPEFVIWTALTVASQLPTTLRLFEDEARGLRPNPLPVGTAQLIDEDPYSGARCIRLSPAKGQGISLADLVVRIRERPLIGEFRYLRFAVRMSGNVRLGMECLPTVEDQRVRKYDAGVGPPAIEGAVRMLGTAPTEWVVKTQDLFANFGAYDLQEIRFLAVGEGTVYLDHLYLARSEQDFNEIGAQDPLTLQQQTEQAQLAVYQQSIEKANAATVMIDVEGQRGTGVLITQDGFIATTAFAAVAPGKGAQVTLADGRNLPAITLGLNRDADAAMLKITTEGEYPFLEIGNSQALPVDGRLATVAFVGDLSKQPKKGASLVRYRTAEGGGLWVSLQFDRSFSGGPLVDREGKLIGLVSRPFGPGGTLAMPMQDFNTSRERLSRSEVWGAWPIAVTPHIGLNVGVRDAKLKIIGLSKDGPAARAGVQVGDELNTFDGQPVTSFQDLLKLLAQKLPGEKVTLQLTRGAQPQPAEITLERR
jgi:S1-C subfamily serine protease